MKKRMAIGIGARRLLKLADYLRTIKPDAFDFNRWVGEDWNGNPNLCGTTACALGWATTIRSFRRAGLRMVKPNFGHGGFVFFRGSYSDGAASKFFDISEDEAVWIFTPGQGPLRLPATASPKQVAAHIRRFVKRKQKTGWHEMPIYGGGNG